MQVFNTVQMPALPLTTEQAAELAKLGAAYVDVVHGADPDENVVSLGWETICDFLAGLDCAGGIMAVDFELDVGDNNGEPCHCLYVTYSFQDTPEATTEYFFNLDF